MRIWEHTLDQLTGGKQPIGSPDMPNLPQPYHPATIVPITTHPPYATAMLKGGGTMAHQVLLEWKDGQWSCVGSYVDNTIHIDDSARGKGLAEELLIRCLEHREALPLTGNFSEKGYSLLKRAHRLAVDRALAANLPVPDKVREEYNKG
jgi:hypothetical protein